MELDSAFSRYRLANFPAVFVGYNDGTTLRTNLKNGGCLL